MSFIDLKYRLSNHSYNAITAYILGTGLLLGTLSWCHSVIALESERLCPSETTQLPQPRCPFSKNGDRAEALIAQTVHGEPPPPQDAEHQQEQERQQELEQQVQQELADFAPSSASSDVIVLGQPDNFPYVIVIPGDKREVLQAVQEIIPTAFITSSRRGRYIYAASFPERRPADALSAQLRYLRFDSQVHYMPTD